MPHGKTEDGANGGAAIFPPIVMMPWTWYGSTFLICSPKRASATRQSSSAVLTRNTGFRNALLNMIALLEERGYTREQAYVISSVAVDLRVDHLAAGILEEQIGEARLAFRSVEHGSEEEVLQAAVRQGRVDEGPRQVGRWRLA